MTPIAAEGFAPVETVNGEAGGIAALILRLHQDSGFNAAQAMAGLALVRRDFAEPPLRTALARAVGAEDVRRKESRRAG